MSNKIFEVDVSIVVESNGDRTLAQIVDSIRLVLTKSFDKAFYAGSDNPIYTMTSEMIKVKKL